jgi:hypothetical protein
MLLGEHRQHHAPPGMAAIVVVYYTHVVYVTVVYCTCLTPLCAAFLAAHSVEFYGAGADAGWQLSVESTEMVALCAREVSCREVCGQAPLPVVCIGVQQQLCLDCISCL